MHDTPLVLAEHGQIRYQIVKRPNAPDVEEYAADELRRHLHQLAGRSPAASAGSGVRIVLNDRAAAEAAGGAVEEALGVEAFRWTRRGEDLFLLAGGPRGVLYGVYELLEALGCRWFTPEVSRIPRLDRIEMPCLEGLRAPRFEFRDMLNGDCADPVWWVRNRMNGCFGKLPDYLGGSIDYGLFVHTFYNLVPPAQYFHRHPEYFSLFNGQRRHEGGQLCLTNPDVLRLTIDQVRARMRAQPRATIFSVSQNDWAGWCECPACQAVEEEEGAHAGPLLRFVNAVAEAVEEEFPDKLIDTLAYHYTLEAPRLVRPRANVRIRLCPITCCQAHPFGTCAHEESGRFLQAFTAWNAITQQIYIWHYCTNFSHYLLPMPNLDELQGNIRFYDARGVHGVFMQGAGTWGAESMGVRGYVLSKLLWNPAREAWAEVDDYLPAVYGTAAPQVRRYLDLFHARVRTDPTLHPSCYDAPTHPLFDDALCAQAEATLADGDARVADPERRQVALLRAAFPYRRARESAARLSVGADVMHTSATPAQQAEWADTVAFLRAAGVENLTEGARLEPAAHLISARLREHPLTWLRAGAHALAIAPGLGGRIVAWTAYGKEWLAPADPANPHLLYPFSGGYAEFSISQPYTYRGWNEEYALAQSSATACELAATLDGGYHLQRTLALTDDGVAMASTLTARNPWPAHARWGAGVQLLIGADAELAYDCAGGHVAQPVAALPDGLDQAVILEGATLPLGCLTVTADGIQLTHAFAPDVVVQVILGRDAARGVLAIDIRSEVQEMTAGTPIQCTHTLQIVRGPSISAF
jgi:hypothetical protein